MLGLTLTPAAFAKPIHAHSPPSISRRTPAPTKRARSIPPSSSHGAATTYKLYASDVAGLHLDPELVTISACRSAGAKAYSGEGLIGFSWAFLNSGARNVVAGIWNVDDTAAPLLMKEFYQEWRGGRDPAAALRGAKLQLMRSGAAFRKPYYWAPFEVFTRQATRSAIDLAWRNKSK